MDVPTLRVLIADDHQIFIEGLKTVLGRSENFDFVVVGEAHTGHGIIKLSEQREADLLLLDMNLPDIDGMEVISQLKDKGSPLRIITLSMYDESKIVKAAFKAGADGYLLKSNNISELFTAISTVIAGNTFLGEGLSLTNKSGTHTRFMHEGKLSVDFSDRFVKKFKLTKREIEVLRLVAHAMSNKDIARELYISDQTVSVHRKNIMHKVGVNSTASLIKLAFENNLV
ncbi:MAG: response regulator transcription factor [Lewinellaceae bacterium]|nr:response regulator transcription factor [Saprospiraceae bacterium]MCB9340715.1 response regulator transcription factor [Lewinellaceae bacterium]